MAKFKRNRPWYIRNVWAPYQETNILILFLEFLVLVGLLGFVLYGYAGFLYTFKMV